MLDAPIKLNIFERINFIYVLSLKVNCELADLDVSFWALASFFRVVVQHQQFI